MNITICIIAFDCIAVDRIAAGPKASELTTVNGSIMAGPDGGAIIPGNTTNGQNFDKMLDSFSPAENPAMTAPMGGRTAGIPIAVAPMAHDWRTEANR
jgi:hypothetical protein